jgi:hypothetical protein
MPLPFLPQVAQKFAVFLPATYLVWGLQAASYLSTPLSRLLTEVLALGCWAILTFFVAAQLFRWEPESKIPRNAKLWAAATALPFLLLGFWENRAGGLLLDSQKAYMSVQNPSKAAQPADAPAQEPAGQDPAKKDQPDHGPF